MGIISKIRRKQTYIENRPLIYDDRLRNAYSTTSVCGGQLIGKMAVVTGATGGIGFSIADRLINEGCHVIITGRSEERLKETICKLSQSRLADVSYLIMDQSDVNNLREGVEKAFAGRIIDLWVNCAGILKKTDRDRVFRGLSAETYNEVIDVNLRSTVLLTRMVAEKMVNQETAMCQIINIASICGLTNHFGYTPYGISKTGVIEYTKRLAAEYKSKVLIEAIAPGSVATIMGTRHLGGDISGTNAFTNHVAMPEETSAVICFLAGPVGKYLNGQTIVASAGEKV